MRVKITRGPHTSRKNTAQNGTLSVVPEINKIQKFGPKNRKPAQINTIISTEWLGTGLQKEDKREMEGQQRKEDKIAEGEVDD